MNIWLIYAVVAILLIVIVFALMKTETKKVTLINSDNKKVTVNAEIAENYVQKARGLMFRNSLDANSGMLFLFNKPDFYSFWMVNTTIPLEAIHFSENGEIVDIIEMDPCKGGKCDKYVPQEKSMYVLEVNQGFSKSNNINIGDKILLGSK